MGLCRWLSTYSPWRLFVSLVGWAGKQGKRRIVFLYSLVFVGNWWLQGRIRVEQGQKESVSLWTSQGAKKSGCSESLGIGQGGWLVVWLI